MKETFGIPGVGFTDPHGLLEQALEAIRREYEARPLIWEAETRNGNLVIKEVFDESDSSKERCPRRVSSILVYDGDHEIDLCSLARGKTLFSTYGAVYVIGDIRQGSLFPVAEAGENPKTGESFIYYNPAILKARGGILMIIHETGHTWDQDSDHPEKVIEGFAEGKKISREQVRKALLAKRKKENFAWRFAMGKYKEFLEKGFNLAPQIPAAQIASYPQLVLDTLYNSAYSYSKAIEFAGREYRLIWEES